MLIAAAACGGDQRPCLCLPPIFEGGQRLHPLKDLRALWLEPLLRQHEICSRRTPGEQRVALFGNSAVLGFPLPVEQSFGARLNTHFAAAAVPAHLFNLAWIFTYQIRDAVIMNEAMRYRPDVLIYPLTLADTVHFAPLFFPPLMVSFFERNTGPIAEMIDAPPPGIAEPIENHRGVVEVHGGPRRHFDDLRDLGILARTFAHQNAVAIASRVADLPGEPAPQVGGRQTDYDCEKTIADNELYFSEWQSWNMLAYLDALRRESGVEVLVINWPVAHEPIGECYNVRYSAAMIAKYNRWIADQARAFNLPFLDLHDLLPPEEFIDSLHVTEAGHRRIAEQVAPVLDPIVRARAARAAQR